MTFYAQHSFVQIQEKTDFQFQPEGPLLAKMEVGEFDKLEPIWDLCRSRNIEVNYWFDFYIERDTVKYLLAQLPTLQASIALRRPFFICNDANDTYQKIYSVLQEATQLGCGILALSD